MLVGASLSQLLTDFIQWLDDNSYSLLIDIASQQFVQFVNINRLLVDVSRLLIDRQSILVDC